jgi:hypothetical protein
MSVKQRLAQIARRQRERDETESVHIAARLYADITDMRLDAPLWRKRPGLRELDDVESEAIKQALLEFMATRTGTEPDKIDAPRQLPADTTGMGPTCELYAPPEYWAGLVE